MQELVMNQMKDRMTGVMEQPVPLFASSWVALYRYFRDGMSGYRAGTSPTRPKQHSAARRRRSPN